MKNNNRAINGVAENKNFRDRLIEYWGGCSVSDCENHEELIAVPIKSWEDCDEFEKNDFNNGLILCENHASLFLEYLISFDELGEILISDIIPDSELQELGISKAYSLKREKLSLNHIVYLEEHKQKFYGNTLIKTDE